MLGQIPLELLQISPILTLACGALCILLVEAFSKQRHFTTFLAGWFLLLAFGFSISNVRLAQPGMVIMKGLLYADPFVPFVSMVILLGSFLFVLLTVRRLEPEGVDSPAEFYSLLLFAVAGALIFVSAAELVTLFVALEIMSLAAYPLAASAIFQKRSSEAGVKYFLLGSFSSALLLYGVVLLYGETGSTFIPEVSLALTRLHSGLSLLGVGLVLVGALFKVGAVPFHFWVPDVYEGSPTHVSAWMSCVIKTAAFGALLRVAWGAFEPTVAFWSRGIWLAAVLSMTLGNLSALRQRSLKRMLAYSSIAHAGYMLMGVLAHGRPFGGGAAILYYLVAYTLMTLGSFAVVLAVTTRFSGRNHPDDISRFYGLGFRQPFVAGCMALFMFALAGLPPGVAGLVGKFFLFNAAIKAEYVGLVIVAVLNSAVSCYYYLRLIVAMYFLDMPKDVVPEEEPWLEPSMKVVLAVCAGGVVLIGVFPSALFAAAARVMLQF